MNVLLSNLQDQTGNPGNRFQRSSPSDPCSPGIPSAHCGDFDSGPALPCAPCPQTVDKYRGGFNNRLAPQGGQGAMANTCTRTRHVFKVCVYRGEKPLWLLQVPFWCPPPPPPTPPPRPPPPPPLVASFDRALLFFFLKMYLRICV